MDSKAISTLIIHHERLRRSFEIASRTYDLPSLLDLSHHLRIWVDLKDELPKHFPEFKSTIAFKSATPPRKTMRLASGSEYLFCYLPGGVWSEAAEGNFSFIPDSDPFNKNHAIGLIFKKDRDRVNVSQLVYIANPSFEPTNQVASDLNESSERRCNFQQYLDAEAIRYQYKDISGQLTGHKISREEIIRRVANAFDGSHPSLSNAFPHALDQTIEKLMSYKAANLSIPYFILLKCAADILQFVQKILDAQFKPNNPA